MPKYIDADALCKKLEKYVPDGWDEYNDGFTTMQANAMSEVEFSPAADVAPVVHGRWIEDDTGIMHYCSECHKYNGSTTYMPKYCPNCGALMDGKDEDNG